jgi:hypothetical protein
VDTKGWDAVFVSSVAVVNKQLAANMSHLITTFDFRQGNVHFYGDFGPWQVTLNGSGKLVRFETPMNHLTLELTAAGGKVTTMPFQNVKPVMEMQLSFIGNPSNSQVKELRFNCTVKGSKPGDQTPGAVTTVTPDASGQISENNPDTAAAWGLLNEHLPELFIANRDSLNYVFAQVNLVPPASDSWLAPKRFEYLYVNPVAGNTGFLAVLAVTTDRDISGLKLEIDGSLLDTTHEVFVAISEGLFLQQVIMPSLPSAFGNGATAANFVYQAATPTSGQIVNQGQLSAGSVREGAIDYYPKINSLSITIDGDKAVTVTNGSFDITGLLNAYVTYDVTVRNAFHYDTATNTFSFLNDPNPSVNYDKHVPWYDYVFALIGGAIILAIVDTVISLVTDSIADSVSHSTGSGGQNTVAQAGAIVVAWNGLEHIQVQSATLAQAFSLCGQYRS